MSDASLTSNGSNDLVWKVCESIRDSFSHCEKCPAEIDSPYGKGKQGCRLHAEEVIALVRGSSETPASPVCVWERDPDYDVRFQPSCEGSPAFYLSAFHEIYSFCPYCGKPTEIDTPNALKASEPRAAAHVQSADQQARDIEPILTQSGWKLALGAIAAVIEALDTTSGPDEVKRLRHIENMALRVASSRRNGIVTDEIALDNLDLALEETKPPEARAFDPTFEAYVAHLSGCCSVWGQQGGEIPPRVVEALKELREYYYGESVPQKAEWLCPCGAPLDTSTAVCRKCFPEGMTRK